MRTPEIAQRTRGQFERLFDALIDPTRGESAMFCLLAAYFFTWSLYAVIAKSSQDIHPDMAEIQVWSRVAGLGTPKHPPLAAWLVRMWFNVFPREDWAYYLFAMLLPTAALWITWRLSARYLPRDKRVVGILLLAFVPFYNFHALKYNANTVLTPLWAAASWWFLSSFETRRTDWSVLAGIGAAAAVLAKYWSVTLLVGLGLAALTDTRRSLFFGSSAPYLTLAIGTILITPHIDWQIAHEFMPFSYAVEAHPATFLTATMSALWFIGGSLAYIAGPILLTLVAARPSVAGIADTLWPGEPERRIVVIAFAAPILFAAFMAIVVRVHIHSLWAISAMTLLPIVLLSSPRVAISRSASVGLLALAIAFPLMMVVASPMIAVFIRREEAPNYANDYRLVARAVERVWLSHSDGPLRIVASGGNLVNGIDFYFANQPLTLDLYSPARTPWVSDERIRRDGMAIVCPKEYLCEEAMAGFADHYHAMPKEHVQIAGRYFGSEGRPTDYEIAIVLPQTP